MHVTLAPCLIVKTVALRWLREEERYRRLEARLLRRLSRQYPTS